MNELLFFLEIVLTFGCVVAAKKIFGKAGLIAWIAIAMILANLTVVKTVNLFGIDATLGNIMFASTFLAGDMLNENYGRQAAHKGILVGLGGVLVFMVCTQISLLYTPSTTDVSHDAMALLFALNLRTSIASVAMCILANWLNVSGMLTFFQPRTSYAASPSDFLYCTGLIPPNDSFIRSSLYQRI